MAPRSTSQELDFDLPPARGGRKPRAQRAGFEVVRELTIADIALRQAPSSKPAAKPPALVRGNLRAAHHQLAQLVARGASGPEIQLITGYSASYISNIKHDPAFCELVAYYGAEGHDLYIDVLAKMRDTGVAAVEEIQSRMRAEAPTNGFSNRELMDAVDLMVVKPMTAVANARRGVDIADATRGNAQQTNVNIKFVQAQPAAITVEHEHDQ